VGNKRHVTTRIVLSIVCLLTALPLPTAPASAAVCATDCDGDERVSINELITAVRIALGAADLGVCPAADGDGDEKVAVAELVQGVRAALDGCFDGAVFLIRACAGGEVPDGQTFRVLIRDPDTIAVADDLVGAGHVQIVTGTVRAGDGGFNAPWSWHHEPDSVAFDDFTIELCDGCPMYVEEHLDEWLDSVGTYCPWSTEVLARER